MNRSEKPFIVRALPGLNQPDVYSGSMTALSQRTALYLQLIRLDRPIGSLLLLWPTWWALWLASDGRPSWANLAIFTLGVFLTRSAGCIVNDYADRDFDRHVKRTSNRPLTTGAVGEREALVFALLLTAIAFALVLLTNPLTIALSFAAVGLAVIYPFMKRYTHVPQMVLGLAFSWGIPMAFAAETNALPGAMWLLFVAAVLWTVVYDTFYAMCDRDDDLKVGIRSTAILFGRADRLITAALQVVVLALLALCAEPFGLGNTYYLGLLVAALIAGYQQWLIRERERMACFRAFLNNNWFGAAVFVGIVADQLIGA